MVAYQISSDYIIFIEIDIIPFEILHKNNRLQLTSKKINSKFSISFNLKKYHLIVKLHVLI